MSTPYNAPGDATIAADPRLILDLNYAFTRTAVLLAAVRLRLFTTLAEHPMTISQLAPLIHSQHESLARFLRCLVELKLIHFEHDLYDLTPLARTFLVEGNTQYLGGDTLAMVDYLPAWLNLTDCLRTNVPYRDLSQADSAEAFFAPHTRDLFSVTHPFAQRLASRLKLPEAPLRILDLGSGAAAWGIAFLQNYPDARLTALDLPAVVAEGREKSRDLGFEGRISWLAGDALTTTLPEKEYDLIVVAHLCRFLGDEQVNQLFPRLYQACAPGGHCLVVDLLLNEDRTAPDPTVWIDVSMLVNTAFGRLFTAQELQSSLQTSGFAPVELLSGFGPAQLLLASKEEQ